jgi:hypothetical protein
MTRPRGPDFYEHDLAQRELYGMLMHDQVRFKPVAFTIRFNREATAKLKEKVDEAIAKGVGVSFVLQEMDGAATICESQAHGVEFKLAAYARNLVFPKSEMKGYKGRYCSLEYYTPSVNVNDIVRLILRNKARWRGMTG